MVDVDSPHVLTVESDFKDKDIKTTTQAERLESEEEKKAAEEKEQAKAKSKCNRLVQNKDNPVVIANALLVTLTSGLLGFGTYHKHTAGKLSWKLVGLWSGAVGTLGVADFYVSK